MGIRRETNKVWMIKAATERGTFWFRRIAVDTETGYCVVLFDGIAKVFAENVAKEEGRLKTYYIPPWAEWSRERILHPAEILDLKPATVSMMLVANAA
jgi:hypothetical protein